MKYQGKLIAKNVLKIALNGIYFLYNNYYIIIILIIISISRDECILCGEGLVLNRFSSQCECQGGYKWNNNRTDCVKCYVYNGDCYEQCPLNTKLDSSVMKCLKIELYSNNFDMFYWSSFIFFMALLVFISWMFVYNF